MIDVGKWLKIDPGKCMVCEIHLNVVLLKPSHLNGMSIYLTLYESAAFVKVDMRLICILRNFDTIL